MAHNLPEEDPNRENPGQDPYGPAKPKKTFVLCFDGTGNKFAGDDGDSNILKIYRMLDRADGNTFTFYQPGIGTYVSSNHFQTHGTVARIKSWYYKSKDAAVGSSFADHVMGGYKFLMRYYSSEDDLYFFGFSRGAYTARFLAEMLDHVGLLSAGNEELARFAWKTYAKWANRRTGDNAKGKAEEQKIYDFMSGFRDTFSRRVRRIRFLGLFDTVNSVPAFENSWMQRTKFPYTARPSAKVIRHAVSIDERRAKFRQDLMAGSKKTQPVANIRNFHRYQSDLPTMMKQQHFDPEKAIPPTIPAEGPLPDNASANPSIAITDTETAIEKPQVNGIHPNQAQEHFSDAPEHRTLAPTLNPKDSKGSFAGDFMNASTENLRHGSVAQIPGANKRRRTRLWTSSHKTQDIQEVWFPGGHGDIGGGWKRLRPDEPLLAQVPLIWMLEEAQKAGLKLDPVKMAKLNCLPDKLNEYGDREVCADALQRYHKMFESASKESTVHDCLLWSGGLGWSGTMAWKMMEYLPFRRMDLKHDGTWKPIRWPLPMGETRDIPDDAQIHVSAIRRLEVDPKYRPGNLVIGGGGRGKRIAPGKFGIGNWDVHSNPGHKIAETYVRRKEDDDDGEPNHRK